MENKNVGNGNKIILGDFICTMDKIDRYGRNKTQKLYSRCSKYTRIVDNGLKAYGEEKTRSPLSSLTLKKSFGKNPGKTGFILI